MADGPGRSFPAAAEAALGDARLRRNLATATGTIRLKRAGAVAELDDWERLRDAGAEIKRRTVRHLDQHLLELERRVRAAGGVVHWARDASDANAIAVGLARERGAREVLKVKSLTTEEIELNAAFETAGIAAVETDLAALIVQLAREGPSHILVPAIHKSRAEIRDTFAAAFGEPGLSDEPRELAEAARRYLRRRFLRVRVAVSGANFAVAETGSICVVESEGNGRMCLTLPETLITVMGIEKVIPEWRDLEVFLQLLPRSSTGERMNPYTSLWTGVVPADGPREFHLILLDNGRTRALADEVGREALHCIRCSACLNICPVYERVGGHAYGSVYPGPIGAILAPQIDPEPRFASLPHASTLCGACYEVCPVKIDIPAILLHLRRLEVEGSTGSERLGERFAMSGLAKIFRHPRAYRAAQRALVLARRTAGRWPRRLPGSLGAWTRSRELPVPPRRTFRQWWRSR